MGENDEVDVVVKDEQYFMEHAEEFDSLSDADRDELLLNGSITVEADTEPVLDEEPAPESDAEAAAATDKKDDPPAEPEVDAATEPEKVILAKDGENTIPFSELEDSRKEVTRLQGIIDENKPVMDQLKSDLDAAKIVDEKAGNTVEQDKLLEELKLDYPSLYEPIEKLMGLKVDALEQKISDLSEKIDSDLKPLQDGAVQSAQEQHDSAIAGVHKNFQEIAGSGKLTEWINSLPSPIMQRAYIDVASKGSAQDVIEMFDAYKKDHPDAAPVVDKDAVPDKDAAAKAAALADGAKKDEPGSLSEVPGGTVHVNEAEAMKTENGQKLLARFEGKTPAQIEEMLARAL